MESLWDKKLIEFGGYFMGMKCFVPDCQEDIIGQCPGLPGQPCGHFYCSTHSNGKICDECAAIIEREKIFETYCDTAKYVLRGPTSIRVLFALAMLAGMIILLIITFNTKTVAVFLIGEILLFAFAALALSHFEKQRLANASSELKDFEPFYKAYKKKATRDMFKVAGVVAGAMVVGAIASSLSSEAKISRDVRRISDKLDRM